MAGYDPNNDLEILRESYEVFTEVMGRVQRNWEVTNVNYPDDIKNFMSNVMLMNPFAGRRIVRVDGQGGPDWWNMEDESAVRTKRRFMADPFIHARDANNIYSRVRAEHRQLHRRHRRLDGGRRRYA